MFGFALLSETERNWNEESAGINGELIFHAVPGFALAKVIKSFVGTAAEPAIVIVPAPETPEHAAVGVPALSVLTSCSLSAPKVTLFGAFVRVSWQKVLLLLNL